MVQVSRLYASLIDQVREDDWLLTSDADLIPLAADYFTTVRKPQYIHAHVCKGIRLITAVVAHRCSEQIYVPTLRLYVERFCHQIFCFTGAQRGSLSTLALPRPVCQPLLSCKRTCLFTQFSCVWLYPKMDEWTIRPLEWWTRIWTFLPRGTGLHSCNWIWKFWR